VVEQRLVVDDQKVIELEVDLTEKNADAIDVGRDFRS
jgi:hypothetical protein